MPTTGKRGTGVPARRPARAVRPTREDGWRKHSDRAWLATQELQRMLPVFTSFARSISGNKTVRVSVGHGSMTDGQTIWVVPPIELGTVRMHDKMLCNKRGEDGILLCKACDTREMVLFPLYHEIGHVSFDSLAEIEEFYRQSYYEIIKEWHPTGVCSHGPALESQAKSSPRGTLLCLNFDPYLMQIFNCMEDARVNASMFRVRPGLSKMFDTQIARLFEKGVPIPHSDEVVRWETADLNAQVCIGLFLISSGYTVGEGYLSLDAIKVLDDENLRAICNDVQMARTVQQTFEYTIRAWRRLQELGVCFKEKCKPAPEEKDGEGTDGEGSGEPGGSDGSGGVGPSSSDSASGEPGGDDSSGSKDSGPDGSGSLGLSSTSDSPVEPDGSTGGGDSEGDTSDTASDDADVSGGGDSGHSVGPDGSDGGDADDVSGGNDGAKSDEGEDPESRDSSDSKGSAGGNPEEPGTDGTGDDSLVEGTSLDEGSGDADTSDEGDRSSSHEADGTESEEDGDDPDADERGDGRGGDLDDVRDADDDWSNDGDDSEEELEDGLADDYGDGDVDSVEYRKALSAMGDPELLARMINVLNSHDPDSTMEDFHMDHTPMEADGFHGSPNDSDIQKALIIAAIQADWFDRSSKNIVGTEVFKAPFSREIFADSWGYYTAPSIEDYRVNPAIINQATLRARVVFDENARSKEDRNLKSGKIDPRVLGRRAPLQDERLFKKKTRPGKRDYFVVIGADCSGSTGSRDRISRIKRAVYAQAEMLHRLGVKFAIYGHTGHYATRILGANPHVSEVIRGGEGMSLWMLEVKSPDGQWDNKAKAALASLQPISANLDGHTMEFYRKVTDKVRATDKIIMYYTDGAMPLENYDEERAILEDEIELIRKKRITLLGVGIDTNSPEQYGLSTVIVRSDDDLPHVVEHLKAQLVR